MAGSCSRETKGRTEGSQRGEIFRTPLSVCETAYYPRAAAQSVRRVQPSTISQPSIDNHRRRSNPKMDIREPFSRLKKKFMGQGSKRKPHRTGADSGAENVDPAGSLSRPVHHIVAGGSHNRGDNRTNADGWRVRSADRTPIPGVPVPRSNNDQEWIDEGEANQRYLHPHLYTRVAVGSGPGPEKKGADGEKVGRVYPSPPAPSITHTKTPNSMQMWSFQLLPLIVPSGNAGTSTVPDHLPEALHPDKGVEPSAAADNNNPGWKFTTSATAKLLLHGVRDSADAFGPLKSVAGGLCFILENCEVHTPSILCCPQP